MLTLNCCTLRSPRLANSPALLPNAARKSLSLPAQETGISLGVDYGNKRTGVAVSNSGLAPQPLKVLQTRGKQLTDDVLTLASDEGADEIIVGLPVSWDQTEGPQAVRCTEFARSLAKPAAENGMRVFLFDEYNTSQEAMTMMIDAGRNKKTRRDMVDAYAAAALLEAYFNSEGKGARIVLPKSKQLQQRLASPPTTANQLASSARQRHQQGAREDEDEDEDSWEFF